LIKYQSLKLKYSLTQSFTADSSKSKSIRQSLRHTIDEGLFLNCFFLGGDGACSFLALGFEKSRLKLGGDVSLRLYVFSSFFVRFFAAPFPACGVLVSYSNFFLSGLTEVFP
jgi:hypothetical protein